MVVSFALIVVGLLVARRLRRGGVLRVKVRHVAAALAGELVIIFSFTLDAGRILVGGMPFGQFNRARY